MYVRNLDCCGIKELASIGRSRPEDLVKEIREYREGNETHPPFYLFSGVTRSKYAQKFADYIKRNKYGLIVETKSKRNPNSGNCITAYLWQVSKKLDK